MVNRLPKSTELCLSLPYSMAVRCLASVLFLPSVFSRLPPPPSPTPILPVRHFSRSTFKQPIFFDSTPNTMKSKFTHSPRMCSSLTLAVAAMSAVAFTRNITGQNERKEPHRKGKLNGRGFRSAFGFCPEWTTWTKHFCHLSFWMMACTAHLRRTVNLT